MNINKLNIPELCQILNSTSFGKVVNQNLIAEFKKKADIPFSENAKINLFKFLAALLDKRHNKMNRVTIKKDQSYEEAKEYQRNKNAEKSASGRDIGNIPEVFNQKRKEDCRFNFRKFLLSYFREQCFPLEFCPAHDLLIQTLQKIILEGGLHALGMPRGTGKTTLVELAAVWAISYGHRQYVVFIGSTIPNGLKSLESIKTLMETTEDYVADFPEIVYPVLALEGINIRANGQMCLGQRTHISWMTDEIILPTIEGSKTSGIILEATGIEGRIRGRKHIKQDGKSFRPDLFICDDFQTDESAANLLQCKKRLSIINKAVIGLAGAGKAIAGFVPCTVIQLGDAADQLLDRDKYPQFQGIKTKMMISFPSKEAMFFWERYNEERVNGLKSGDGNAPANAFYIKHRKAMEDGCEVYWNDRYNRDTIDANGYKVEGEISAIQSAMNLYLTDEESFFSEYQNEPKSLVESLEIMKPADFMKKLNKVPERIVPLGSNTLVTYIDVQKKALYYVTMAFEDNFTGYVIDHGTYPDQKKAYFSLDDIKITLEGTYRGMGLEAYLFQGLSDLTDILADKEYITENVMVMRHSTIMVDANWGASTNTVYAFCRKHKYASILIPSHGVSVKATSKPLAEVKKQLGDKIGDNWKIPHTKNKRLIPYILIDTNYWKSFTHARINTALGDKGCLSLYGDKEKAHELYADHLCKSEFVVEVNSKGRKVNEWSPQLSFKENHWFDCTVGCHVAASYNGVSLGEISFKVPKKDRKNLVLSDMQKESKGKNVKKEQKIPENIVKTEEKPINPTKNERKMIVLSDLQKKNQNTR